MFRQKPSILFLCHSASRNGATIVLLDFVKWLDARKEFDITVLMDGSGDLVDSFKKVAPTKIWRNLSFLTHALAPSFRARFQPWLEQQSLRLSLGLKRFDLVYANTAATGRHLPFLATRSRAIVWHIHELESSLRLILGPHGAARLFPLATRFIAASNSCQTTLIHDFQAPAAKVDVVHDFISAIDLPEPERLQRRARIRQQLGWSNDAFVVGGCGTPGWRKGSDIFLQLARLIRESGSGESIHFLWVGGKSYEQGVLEFEHDLKALSLQGTCRLTPSTAEVFDYYCAMDVFAMTSREDTFALVNLEAAALGLPLICFADSGGAPEFAGDDAGLVAPYLDVGAFAAQIKTLHFNPELRRRLATVALDRMKSDYTTATQAPKLLQSINRSLRIEEN